MAKREARRLENIPIELRFSREVLQDRDALPSRRGWLGWIATALGDAFEIYGYDAMVYPYRDS